MKTIVDAPVAAGLPYSAAVVAAGPCFVAGPFGTIDGVAALPAATGNHAPSVAPIR